mmetsp:Transcript_34747/g.45946  ORF Transcript_34747/g.45946 Transcript_34747/m.45946 type:complete len:239 (+) Transcript_34747:61-777(+)
MKLSLFVTLFVALFSLFLQTDCFIISSHGQPSKCRYTCRSFQTLGYKMRSTKMNIFTSYMKAKGFGKPQQNPKKKEEESKPKKEKPVLGTLFKSNNEEIRELDSDEYLAALQEWVPMSKFASSEVKEQEEHITREAKDSFETLSRMVRWQPPQKQKDFTKQGSGWAFGCAVGAFMNGQLDAIACLEIHEKRGVLVKYAVANPLYLGVESNCRSWLLAGVSAIAAKKLDMHVEIPEKYQ